MDLAKRWRQKAPYYRLEGQRHRSTGAVRFPPRAPALGETGTDWEPCPLSGKGQLYSFSGVRQPPHGLENQVPYLVGMVQLEEGPLVVAQLTDCREEELTIGQPMEMVTRKIKETGEDGLIVYSYKFRPVLGQ
jgi:hypothetical protein